MAKVISVKPKTVSLANLRTQSTLQCAANGQLPHMQMDRNGDYLEGIITPLNVRVRTEKGIFETQYFFSAREQTIRLTLDDGYVFEGTQSHKMMTDRYSDQWETLNDLRVGDHIEGMSSRLRIIDKQLGPIQAVGDICVPGPHSYLLENGAVSHNSLMANQIAKNMAERGFKVVIVPLEMSKVEMTSRLLANVSKLDVTRILQKRLASGEKELVASKFERWSKKVKNAGGRLTVYKPLEDVSIEDVFSAVASFDADVVIVDYISLLAGTDGDDSWQQLGAIARLAKINAEATNRVNMLLCQVSDEGKIRYARAISEHCVTGDTLIHTKDGLVRIDSLYPEAEYPSSKTLEGVLVKSHGEYRPASAVHYNGVRKVYTLTLEDGRAIRSTSQHGFELLKEDGTFEWKKLEDLSIGDYIAVDHGDGSFASQKVKVKLPVAETHHNTKNRLPTRIVFDEDLGYVLGCLVSDGHVKGGLSFVASDETIFKKFKACWISVFGLESFTERTHLTPNNVRIWRLFASGEIATFLRSIKGMFGHADKKYVPDVILRSPKSVVCSFLAGVFDGDGSFSSNTGYLHSISRENCVRVQLLLRNLGISSTYDSGRHRVGIGGLALEKFKTLVPITAAKADVVSVKTMKSRTDYVPRELVSDRLVSMMNRTSPRLKKESVKCAEVAHNLVKAGVTYYQYGALGNIYYTEATAAARVLDDSPLKGVLDTLVGRSRFTRVLRVTSIEKGEAEPVYDLTVPGPHCYVANGISVHNSTNSWIWVASKEEREKAVGRIKIEQPKARNSKSFPFEVGFDWAHMAVVPVESVSSDVGDIAEPMKNLTTET